MSKTEGGEALPEHVSIDGCTDDAQEVIEHEHWWALWTHSRCEQLVHDQLAAKEFETFLPKLSMWSQRAGVRRRILTPMFPGYLFVRDQLTDRRYGELLSARGLVAILSGGKGSPAAVPDNEIEAIRVLVDSNLQAKAHPYLRAGQRVRITEGPLADVVGVLIDRNAGKGLLVLSVNLFQRSVAVEIDCASAIAV